VARDEVLGDRAESIRSLGRLGAQPFRLPLTRVDAWARLRASANDRSGKGPTLIRIACGLPAPRWRRMVKNVTLPSRLMRAPNPGSI
jgi:hypothetical protein